MEDPIIEAVIQQIRQDLFMDDVTAIHELLQNLPKKRLLAYLPEETVKQLEN